MNGFIEIQRKLVNALMRLPPVDDYAFRSSLLQGLPPAPLNRSQQFAQLDLNNIISGLQQLGRLTDQGGTRPVVVVVDNALQYVSPGSEVAQALNEVKLELAAYYGGDIQHEPTPLPGDVEALIFGPQRDNRLPLSFVADAVRTARSVMRLAVPRIFGGVPDGDTAYGTGWLIAPGVVITNHHVIEARDHRPPPWGPGEPPADPADFRAQAEQVEAWLDYYVEVGGQPLKCNGAQLLASDDYERLDYAVIELAEANKVADRDPLHLVRQQPNLVRGSRMNIVQHSRGGPLQLAIRNNFFVRNGDTPDFIRYQTDTEPGASGSPVCDDNWRVVGLHHSSVSVPQQQVPQDVIGGQPVTATLLNEAIAIHSVLNSLPPALKQRILDAQQ